MAKEKLEELEEDVEEEETEQSEESSSAASTDFKSVVIKECERIIDKYIEICKSNNDTVFLEKLDDPDKEKKYCVNHIMNNLTKKRIYGGADSVMYEYIHEYYVDDFKEVKDNWSAFMRTPSSGGSTTTKKTKPTLKDIEEGYNALSNEEKNRIYLEQLAKYEEEAKKKALEKIKADEAKKKEKEKELAAKKKAEAEAKAEAERKRKEEEANEPLGGMFDLL